ncbi:ATP-binding cassette domain-containing protein [Campylobacter sp. CNRCH_2016_0050h]|uniref:ATP-binding cassette domain-containing protein n=1 Tax=Campylobacter sp. CNRCH_2016_0050h TaxID=2911608 RepID=UPI0021E67D89|nr:ATP-binding cassette domain-containing protein [Campylobacter sp. CNRCH_2016_0050h]MCV3457103.1 ATP-binding cassette domain-containing protein [Campylobacter sp. CNRCH_2016_0050h]
MILQGIQTHNLKNITFFTKTPEIIGIYGVSGGGKSSLALHTIYSLCSNSFNAIENGFIDDIQYIVKDYKDLMPVIAIKQLNLNTNPRSTIYSYLNFSSALSSMLNIDYDMLRLNKPKNECQKCKASGYVFEIDTNKVIDFDAKIIDTPIIPFRKYEYLRILFLEFCNYHNIDQNKTFRELQPEIQNLLLYINKSHCFTIKYRHNKKLRTKHLEYIGVMLYLQERLNSDKISVYKEVIEYCKENICDSCNGSKINLQIYKNIFIGNISFYDFLTTPMIDLVRMTQSNVFHERIKNVLTACCDFGIGYLSLNRSIPTLSGGEIQKLNFANLVSIPMSNLLIIIDEISSGLHHSDYKNIWKNILSLKERKNTIVLVEHNLEFLNKCDRRICLGPVGGKNGGYIIEDKLPILKPIEVNQKYKKSNFLNINININNINSQRLLLPYDSFVAIVGKSGSGKSSLALFLEKNIDNCIYISQRLPRGNIRSSVASYLEANKVIASFFSSYFNKNVAYFINSGGSEIICPFCDGTGIIRYDRGFESSIDIVCPQCNGKMFNELALKYTIRQKSILDIYNYEINDLDDIGSSKLSKIITLMRDLSLGHLSFNRKINTLSGGELKRIKILKNLLKKIDNKILIIDEPSSGLDYNNAQNIINILKSAKTLTTIIIEHNPRLYLQSDYIIELGPGSGSNGGKIIFQGFLSDYKFNILNDNSF